MFYAEDLMAPITKPGRTCERCKRRMWRGYLLSAPASGVITEILVETGVAVPVGTRLAVIDTDKP